MKQLQKLLFLGGLVLGGCTGTPATVVGQADAQIVLPDALVQVTPDAAPPPPPLVCDNAEPTLETGHHNIGYGLGGTGCLGACHDGILGPKYSVAGTLYDRRLEGGNPVPGAYIYVTDANGTTVKMKTAQNGNFWSAQDLQPPLRTHASGCPSVEEMVASTTGNCNMAGCHPSNDKIYLIDVLQP